ncbi:hypothetical protein SNE40_000347 [Patella caerulea]|uniref:ADP-ribosylglycohydrolase n=2 Tax=Patella caerulea TaxID=87958 RepID=A0AAN8KAA2_PATCE
MRLINLIGALLLKAVPSCDTPTKCFSSSIYRTYHTTSTRINTHISNIDRSMEKPPPIPDRLKRAKEEAMWGMHIADAIAMPVHWYYNADDIKWGYGGWLTGYNPPNKKHPTSILTISNFGGSGRAYGQKSQQVIGNIILHDKLPFWTSRDRNIHYHQGMSAGDNTLNTLMALQMLQTIIRVDKQAIKPDSLVREAVLEDYVKFMTTPGTHNDTYCESFHRSFFKDWMTESKPPKLGADIVKFAETRLKNYQNKSEDSQLLAIGALVLTIPWIIRTAHQSETECANSTVELIKLTHPTPSLYPFVDLYARLLHGVLNGKDLRAGVLEVSDHSVLGGSQTREELLSLIGEAERHPKGSEKRLRAYQNALSDLGMACYIEGAMTSMLFLAYEFSNDFEGGVLANANCGGENCHRGGALGALLGAASVQNGADIPQKWKDGLGVAKSRVETAVRDMNC